jgi:hypothetical protein
MGVVVLRAEMKVRKGERLGQSCPGLMCLSTRGSLCRRCKGLPGPYAPVKLVNGKPFALSDSMGRKDRSRVGRTASAYDHPLFHSGRLNVLSGGSNLAARFLTLYWKVEIRITTQRMPRSMS